MELDFRPAKNLGQNFVHEAQTVRKIVSALRLDKNDRVMEVGPGLGSVTLGLLGRGCTVAAIEADPVLAARLPITIKNHAHSEFARFSVQHRDFLALRPEEIIQPPTAVVASLPSNVAAQGLLKILSEFESARKISMMVQPEVAHRVTATPGSRNYCALSVKVRYFGKAARLGIVPPSALWPKTQAYWELVRIDRHPSSALHSEVTFREQLFELIEMLFTQGRKTSRNALREWAGSGDESARRLLAASIDPARPVRTLDATDLRRLLLRSTTL